MSTLAGCVSDKKSVRDISEKKNYAEEIKGKSYKHSDSIGKWKKYNKSIKNMIINSKCTHGTINRKSI